MEYLVHYPLVSGRTRLIESFPAQLHLNKYTGLQKQQVLHALTTSVYFLQMVTTYHPLNYCWSLQRKKKKKYCPRASGRVALTQYLWSPSLHFNSPTSIDWTREENIKIMKIQLVQSEMFLSVAVDVPGSVVGQKN